MRESVATRIICCRIFCCLGAMTLVVPSGAAEGVKQENPEPDAVRLVVSGSLTAEPAVHAVTFDSVYGREFGIRVADCGSNAAFVSAFVAQIPAEGTDVVKTFAGLPFCVTSLASDKDVKLSERIKITLAGGAKQIAWKDIQSCRLPGRSHIDGEKGGVRLNGLWLLAVATRITDWGLVRQNGGRDISVLERHLNRPRVWASLAKSSIVAPSEKSEVPCLCDKEGFPRRAVPTATGVVWIFEKAGTEITVGTDRYRADKDGATIEFTATGPVMKGVARCASQQPQAESAASQQGSGEHRAGAHGGSEDMDVVFGPTVRGGMTVSYKGKLIQASQVGQCTAVQVTEKDGKTEEVRVPVALWTAVPFHAGKTINVEGFGGLALGTLEMGHKDFYFPRERVIQIEDSDDGFTLMPSKDSLVPIWIDMTGGGLQQELLVRAANVTWVFKTEGTKFKTITHEYVTTKAGAKVLFRKEGVTFDGVSVTEKKKSQDRKDPEQGANANGNKPRP